VDGNLFGQRLRSRKLFEKLTKTHPSARTKQVEELLIFRAVGANTAAAESLGECDSKIQKDGKGPW
jgi:hypothetical protein